MAPAMLQGRSVEIPNSGSRGTLSIRSPTGRRLARPMSGSRRRALHPLLLERGYWRNRLQVLKLARPSVLLVPRPELSTPTVEVDEFRIRAHDGIRLFGLRAQSRHSQTPGSIRIRVVGPCELPQVDLAAVDRGTREFVLQLPAGRRLEDRVLDVLRVCQLASNNGGESTNRVSLVAEDREHEPDEFLIASQLLAAEIEH